MAESIIDVIGRSKAFSLMEEAVLKAANDNERLGLPKAVMVDGIVHRKHADGSLERVENPQPMPASKVVPPAKKSLSKAA